jgi:hypothetical protein
MTIQFLQQLMGRYRVLGGCEVSLQASALLVCLVEPGDAGAGNSRHQSDQLEELLSLYGWNRWAEASSLCNLTRSVTEVKLGGRATLLSPITPTKDFFPFLFALSLLAGADSLEFDHTFETRAVAEAGIQN